jgi:hypothetical protein
MFRDVSNVSDQSCNVLFDNQTLGVYSGTQVQTYKLISDKYYLLSTNDFSGFPTGDNCLTNIEIQTLPSTYDFMTPVFHLMAILSVMVIFFAAYKIILYPFFRHR